MKTYLRNVWLWLRGFRWLWTRSVTLRDGTWVYTHGDNMKWTEGAPPVIAYKPGWNAWRFLPVYLLDHGAACILLAIGVQPISRWAGDHAHSEPWRTLARWLNKIDDGHTSAAGGLLWGSQPCSRTVRYYVMLAWAGLLGWWIA